MCGTEISDHPLGDLWCIQSLSERLCNDIDGPIDFCNRLVRSVRGWLGLGFTPRLLKGVVVFLESLFSLFACPLFCKWIVVFL